MKEEDYTYTHKYDHERPRNDKWDVLLLQLQEIVGRATCDVRFSTTRSRVKLQAIHIITTKSPLF